MAEPMPHPGVWIRKLLLEDPDFQKLAKGVPILLGEVPDPLKKPVITVAVVGMSGDDPMLRKPIVQVTPWVPSQQVTHSQEDPAVTAWNLAARAGAIIGRKRNITISDTAAMSVHWIDGPVDLFDTKRGKDRVLYYAPVRFMCALRLNN